MFDRQISFCHLSSLLLLFVINLWRDSGPVGQLLEKQSLLRLMITSPALKPSCQWLSSSIQFQILHLRSLNAVMLKSKGYGYVGYCRIIIIILTSHYRRVGWEQWLSQFSGHTKRSRRVEQQVTTTKMK